LTDVLTGAVPVKVKVPALLSGIAVLDPSVKLLNINWSDPTLEKGVETVTVGLASVTVTLLSVVETDTVLFDSVTSTMLLIL